MLFPNAVPRAMTKQRRERSRIVYVAEVRADGTARQYILAEGPVAKKICNAIADAICTQTKYTGLAIIAGLFLGIGLSPLLARRRE